MVDQAKRWANRTYLYDFVPLILDPKKTKPAIVRDLYVIEGLSKGEIAERLDISKTAVSGHLKQLEIKKKHTGRDPNNYKFPRSPPYGFKVVDGKLVQNPREIKMARMIIQLKDRDGLTWKRVIEEMNRRNFKSRIGEWTIDSARSTRARWVGKL